MAMWADLSDAELRARLHQRGCPDSALLVRNRDDPQVARRITEWLARKGDATGWAEQVGQGVSGAPRA